MALEIIGYVDYDIEKECRLNIEQDGYDDIVNEILARLQEEFGFTE